MRRVAANGTITTVAGLGNSGFSGDGGPAVAAQLDGPADVSPASGGAVLIADTGNSVIRAVSSKGVITTVAGVRPGGSGSVLPSTTPRLATRVRLAHPEGVTSVRGGGYLIADTDGNMVLRVTADGMLRVVAGTGTSGDSGDGGPATSARLRSPTRVIPAPDGGFFVLDLGNQAVRRVSSSGTITTVPGKTFATDIFGQPVSALVNAGGLAQDSRGDVFVVYGHQVERISSSGVETPVAGTTTCGSTGDGGPAADATLAAPSGLAIMSSGDLLIADGHNENVRRVRFADGTITTLAGAGSNNQLPGCIAAGGGPTGSLWPLFYITEPSSARAFRAITIQFITTRAALVRTTLSRNGQTLRSVDRTSRPGSNSVTLKRGVPAGRYTMRITASSDLANNWPDEGGTLHVAKHFQASLQVR